MSYMKELAITLLQHQQETEGLLRDAGLPLEALGENFIWYHLTRGRTPQEIVAIALGGPASHGKGVQ